MSTTNVPSFVEEERAEPTADELTVLGNLIQQWRANEEAIAAVNDNLAALLAIKTSLEVQQLPAAMASAGDAKRIILGDGTEIKLGDFLYASIKKANEPAAFAWLETNGLADIIKDELKIMLGRGDVAASRAQGLLAACEALGIDAFSRKRGVHASTLQATLKEQLAKGVDVPKDLFGVYQETRAVIKEAK